MGRPVTGSVGPIGNWTEDDLTNFIQKHLDRLPPQTLTPFLHAQKMRIGEDGLDLSGPISYRSMVAPIVVSANDGPQFQNGYTDTTGGYGKVQFFKDPFGWVHLHGATQNGVGTPNTTMFTLPPGFRPDVTIVVTVPTDVNTASFAPINIFTDGTVVIESGTRTSAYLTGVKFPTISNV